MKTINFEKIEMFTDLAKTNKIEQNIKEMFANILYTQGSGIEMHALALKIYNSNGAAQYTEKECEIITQTSHLCAPFFIDAIKNIMEKQDDNKTKK